MPDHAPRPRVGHFREILLWPLQLMPLREHWQIQNHWQLLEQPGADNPWLKVDDDFSGDAEDFPLSRYREFATFLPHVRRFLYGDGKGSALAAAESPIRVFRRSDVQRVRCTFPDPAQPPLELDVARVELFFFYDIDVTVLAIELHGADIALDLLQELTYRFGRAYPVYWEADGSGGHCLQLVEWLAADGRVLAASDYQDRGKFVRHVGEYRAPIEAAHWEFLLRPLVQHHSAAPGLLRYRQLEYHRMLVMAYLAFDDDPRRLSRNDFMRLALITPPGAPERPPFQGAEADAFEVRHCYDRFWNNDADGAPGVRYLCCGEAFTMVGSVHSPYFFAPNGSLLEQFRHQYFLLFLIPHLHKATLLMLSDRLVYWLKQLDIGDPESVKRFKREIRKLKEIFLRFTHRYWFRALTDQYQARELYRMQREFLGTEALYAEVRERIEDMIQYLESDSLRRQANTVVRLTVVTAFGLIGTTVTGYFGMNLLGLEGLGLPLKLLYFFGVLGVTTWVTFYTVVKSKRLSDFLDLLSDEREPPHRKIAAFLKVWMASRRADD